MIIFLRHGQAENNTKKILAGRSSGVNLTQEGIKQAEQAAEMLKSLNVSAIYSSPIDRASITHYLLVGCRASTIIEFNIEYTPYFPSIFVQ